MKDLKAVFAERVRKFLPVKAIAKIVASSEYYVAGGFFTGDVINDYDLFPVTYAWDYVDGSEKYLSFESPNASSYRVYDYKIQVCNHVKSSLRTLIDSFDFAHCQIGAKVSVEDISLTEVPNIEITDVVIEYSQDFVQSRILQDTWYTGSEYPTSSLVRLFKYVKRGFFRGKSWMPVLFSIVSDLKARGFRDYDDFKSQLDAVDLWLVPEEYRELGIDDLTKFYHEFKI